ncbi:sulfotransferase family 2 domain-containing protein [Citreimonas sp.]|uniref:sulfotransferase family 2 domain-containing protein n=1 Tax=Citreimonas sp. TaxID=3036715 RepID=UPI0040591325
MPICTFADKVLFFAHIPKTAGSSVEAYLRQKGHLSLFGEPKISGVHRQHLTRSQVERIAGLPEFDQSFAIVRDPVSRLASEYLWRSEPLKPLQRLLHPFSGHTRRRIKVCGRKRSLTFAEWVPLVLDEARDDPGMRDNHMRPQVEFLAPGDRLFLFENGLRDVFGWIDAQTDGQAAAPPDRLKASGSASVKIDASSRELIEAHFEDDVALHMALREGRTIY